MRAAVIAVIVEKLESLDLGYPKVDDNQREEILKAKRWLEEEG
jgi:hypothetical protein